MPEEEVRQETATADRLATQDEVAVALGSASRYAEDVCKQWLASIFNVPTGTFGPPIGYTAHIKLDPTSGATAMNALTMELAVVDGDYTLDVTEYGDAGPSIRANVPRLLQAAHLYTKFLVAEHLAEHMAWTERALRPTPWGTLYFDGTPSMAPRIGVVVRRLTE